VAAAHGLPLADVKGTGPQGRVTREDVEGALARQVQVGRPGAVVAVPAARRLARELGVDLTSVAGTGPGGRIQPGDVQTASEASAPQPVPQALPGEPALPTAQQGVPAVRRIVPLSSVRRTIGERMAASVREAPQFTVSLDVQVDRALSILEDLKAPANAADGPRVTLTALLVKACAWALAEIPEANAALETAGQVTEWADINIGVAIATEQGLVVPVLHHADQKGVRAIAREMAELADRARGGRLRLEDLRGGTFTLSNLGMFGIDRFDAILNPPQAAILAVGRASRRPLVGPDDQIRAASVATLTLTADHRVLDGAVAARFLATVGRAVERPGLLLG
jgi:pyruvate dehydrogenase E2 component (dihydrolipoamide acetyltransferase)